MSYLKKTLSILLLFSLSLFVYADKVEDNTVFELLVLSGLKSQVESLPATIVALIQQSTPNLSNEKKKQAEVLFADVFNSDLVLSDVSNEIKKTLTEQEAKQVLAWYESNTGSRIARAEEYASTPKAMMEFQKIAAEIMSNSELMSTAQKLSDELKLVEESVEFQKTVMLATMVGLSKADQPDKPVDIEQLEGFVDMQLGQAKSQIEQMITAQLAFSYKDIDKSSMAQYLDVLKRPSMKKFNASNAEGTKTALNKALDRLLSAQ